MGGSDLMADAGKAMMLYKGVYDSTIEYEILDVVNYNGSLYISKINNNLDYEPTLDETKWQLFLEGGTSENIKVTDTQGIVGDAGSSSFVQTLLDGIAEKLLNITAEDIGAMPDIITVTEYPYNGITDVLKLPIGRYRFPDYGVWNSFENVPNTSNGILEVASSKKGNQDPWSKTWNYKQYIYRTSTGNAMYFRALNSGATVGELTDSGWVRFISTANVLHTPEEINANTAGGNVAGALALKEVISAVDTKMTLSLKPFSGDITPNEIFEIIKNKTDTYFSWVAYNDVKYNPLGTSGNWQYEILNVCTNNVSYLYLKATKINTGEQWIYTKAVGWVKASLGNKKYGTLTTVNADDNIYSYIQTIGGEFGILNVTCFIDKEIPAWEESILYTSNIKPTNDITFLLIRQDDRQVLRCVFNTNGEVVAQARGLAFPGGWVGGSCIFM